MTLTYPDFYQWWQSATSAQQKATKAAEEDQEFSITTRGSDDFAQFVAAKQIRDHSQEQLARLVGESEWQPDSAGILNINQVCRVQRGCYNCD